VSVRPSRPTAGMSDLQVVLITEPPSVECLYW
jgi:hypothetical protein